MRRVLDRLSGCRKSRALPGKINRINVLQKLAMRMTNLGSSGPDGRGLSIKLRLVESSIGVVELRHLHGHAYLLDGLFKVPPDLRIFVLVFNQCSTLASAGANAFLVDRAPTAEKIFSGLPAIPERQLTRRLFAGIKVLMEPPAGGTQYAPRSEEVV